jgi:predicted MFS family arabinose efflux permease
MNRPVLAVGLVGFSAFLGLYATQPLLPMLSEAFSASKVAVSLTISAATLGVAVAAPWVGVLSDLTGRKKIIVPALWMLGLTYLFAAMSNSLSTLVFFRFLQGLLTPAVFAVAVAYINEEWRPAETGYVTSVYVSGTVLGGFTGRMLSGLLASVVSWHGAFVALGVLALMMAAAVSAWLPKAKHFTRASSLKSAVRDMGAHLRNRSLLTIYAVGFTILFCLVASFTYVTFHLAAAPFFLGTSALGTLSTVYLVGVVVTPLAGRWSNRIAGWKLLALSQLVSMLGVLLTLPHRLVAVIIGLTLCSSGVFVSQLVANRSIGIVAGRARASAVGLYVTIYYLGGFAGSTVPGLMWSLGGWPVAVALIAAVISVALVVVLTSWRSREQLRRRLEEAVVDDGVTV